MHIEIHKSESRGHANHGWLDTHHSFSFAHYYNPDKIGFGLLRVLNDDVVAAGAGFGTHPHNNMEIVSIPLKGALAHRDSTGTEGIINTGDVQIMSAGRGITHSEYNASKSENVNFLQIWVLPKDKNIEPRHDQKKFSINERVNKWQTVVAPDNDDALWINQDAWFSLGHFEKGNSANYTIHNRGNGVYILVIEGEVKINEAILSKRDAAAIADCEEIGVQLLQDSELLIIEIPMN
ncbi:pirin family protein [Hyphobacterium sp. CCMP332]|nr:pirin family protein [Hyphobacterium sp. CCMP332]